MQMLYVEPRPSSHQGGEDMASADNDDDDLDDKEEDKEEKKTLKARLQAIQVSFLIIVSPYMLNWFQAPRSGIQLESSITSLTLIYAYMEI
jgi:hypothetical protein